MSKVHFTRLQQTEIRMISALIRSGRLTDGQRRFDILVAQLPATLQALAREQVRPREDGDMEE